MNLNRKYNAKVITQKSKLWKGQSLIEVMIALAVVVALAISLVSTTLIGQKSSQNAKNNTQATKLVQQNIEQARIIRDYRGFSYFKTLTNSPPCYKLVSTSGVTPLTDPKQWYLDNSAGACPEVITVGNVTFSRSVLISTISTPPDQGEKKSVTVAVSWRDSEGDQTIKNNTIISSWCSGSSVDSTTCQ